MRAALALAALTACTSFASLDRGVCGNGVIEAGEDCDSSDARCVACARVCAAPADCPSADYTCGVDGLCHAPGGALASPVTAGPFAVDEYRITDVDGDRVGDVLGLSKTSLVVRHGAASGQLAQVDSFVTPSQTGPAAFGYLDLDDSLDVAITTEDGLVAYTSPYRTLAPLDAAALVVGDGGQPMKLLYAFRISDLAIGAFIDDDAGHVVLATADLLGLTQPAVESPCLARNGPLAVADFDPARVDVYQASKDSDLSQDLVVAAATGTGADQKLCVVAVHKDLLGTATLDDITPANAPGPAAGRHPVLADLDTDGDHCPGLVDANGTPAATRYWDGATSGGHCTLAAAGAMLPANSSATQAAAPVGRIALDPPILGVAADALMLTDGIYAYVPAGAAYYPLYRTTRTLWRSAVADLDGDGEVDAVLATRDEDDLDVLYRSSSPNGYQLVRLDTASQVTTVTTGDFDGNGTLDVAYTEQLADHQRLMVAYSTTDRIQPPVEVGSFARAVSVLRLQLQDSVDVIGAAADLAIVQPAPTPTASPTITIFHGSPQRTMTPYLDPRPDPRDATIFRGAVIGGRAGAAYANVLGIAPPAPGKSGALLAWRVPGTPQGLDATEAPGVAVAGLADCEAGQGAGVCLASAAYLPWALDDAHDVVIAVDRAQPAHAAVLDPWSGAGVTAQPITAFAAPPGSAVRALHAADLAGDGAHELVAAFAPVAADGTASAVLVCAVDAAGLPGACTDLVPQIKALAPETRACLDAAPGRVGYRDPFTSGSAGADLVVLCRDAGSTLYRVQRAADGTFAIDALAHSASLLASLQLGDVTGDGIDDVAAIAGDSGSQTLVVYPQCTSRNVASCARGAERSADQ